jgi:serine/threonine protein kinase
MATPAPHRPAPAITGFEYLELLGTGGFSDVYLYQQKLPRRKVAIKVLHVDSLNRQLRRQFVGEANLMAQLSSHPAIATIFAASLTEDEHPYLVMEFCSGGSLGSVYREKPLDISEVLSVGVRVASALESAHRAGIVHRDVKPANILITDYGAPVLTDFGISIGDDGVAESTMLRGDSTTGLGNDTSTQGLSVPWAPPEAFDDVPVSNERSDIYSLGATLFSLLEGRTPFEIAGASNGAVQLSRRIERGEVNPGKRDDVPDSLRLIIERSMAVRPANRFPSALELATALQSVQRELGLSETPIEVARDATPLPVTPEPDASETIIRSAAPAVASPDLDSAPTSVHPRIVRQPAAPPPPARQAAPPEKQALPTPPVPVVHEPTPRNLKPLLFVGAGTFVAAIIAVVVVVNLPTTTPDVPADAGLFPICDDRTLEIAAPPIDVTARDFRPVDALLVGAVGEPDLGLLCGYEVTSGVDGVINQAFYFDGTGSTYETIRDTLPSGMLCNALTVIQDTEGRDVNTQYCTDGKNEVRLYKFIQGTPEPVMGEASYVVVEVNPLA